jgi:arylsulfatase A-like enzyme
MKLLPQIMKENGYYTFNHGKTDYNFVWDSDQVYSDLQGKSKATRYNDLVHNQPFFGQIQTGGGKNSTRRLSADRKTPPGSVSVPADYPQNQLYRETVAQHCDAIRVDDDRIGNIMQGLKAAGLLKNTVVVYFSDHGANNLVRHKQMPTEGGLHVPFIITGPDKYVPKPGVRNDLVNLLDLSATTLAWAGIEQPDWFEGQDLFGPGFKPRSFVASAKDRLDHTLDRVRSIRTERFRYTRNYKTDRIFLQPQYRDRRPFLVNLHELYEEGALSETLKEIYFGERPPEEFYDVSKDPAQLNNLVGAAAYETELKRHRMLLDEWLAKGDAGEGEEKIEAMKYNADGKKWGSGVNPEYETYRPDSDGDGLSDVWEKVNRRDPQDGRLVFEFDCGGWQTEGWKAAGIANNICGFLGFLDFALDQGKGAIERSGLRANVMDSDKYLTLKLRTSADLKVQAVVNGNPLGSLNRVSGGKGYKTIKMPLAKTVWKGTIQSLRLDFEGEKGTFIEIDSILVERSES